MYYTCLCVKKSNIGKIKFVWIVSASILSIKKIKWISYNVSTDYLLGKINEPQELSWGFIISKNT